MRSPSPRLASQSARSTDVVTLRAHRVALLCGAAELSIVYARWKRSRLPGASNAIRARAARPHSKQDDLERGSELSSSLSTGPARDSRKKTPREGSCRASYCGIRPGDDDDDESRRGHGGGGPGDSVVGTQRKAALAFGVVLKKACPARALAALGKPWAGRPKAAAPLTPPEGSPQDSSGESSYTEDGGVAPSTGAPSACSVPAHLYEGLESVSVVAAKHAAAGHGPVDEPVPAKCALLELATRSRPAARELSGPRQVLDLASLATPRGSERQGAGAPAGRMAPAADSSSKIVENALAEGRERLREQGDARAQTRRREEETIRVAKDALTRARKLVDAPLCLAAADEQPRAEASPRLLPAACCLPACLPRAEASPRGCDGAGEARKGRAAAAPSRVADADRGGVARDRERYRELAVSVKDVETGAVSKCRVDVSSPPRSLRGLRQAVQAVAAPTCCTSRPGRLLDLYYLNGKQLCTLTTDDDVLKMLSVAKKLFATRGPANDQGTSAAQSERVTPAQQRPRPRPAGGPARGREPAARSGAGKLPSATANACWPSAASKPANGAAGPDSGSDDEEDSSSDEDGDEDSPSEDEEGAGSSADESVSEEEDASSDDDGTLVTFGKAAARRHA